MGGKTYYKMKTQLKLNLAAGEPGDLVQIPSFYEQLLCKQSNKHGEHCHQGKNCECHGSILCTARSAADHKEHLYHQTRR